jgi:hypothetical protein
MSRFWKNAFVAAALAATATLTASLTMRPASADPLPVAVDPPTRLAAGVEMSGTTVIWNSGCGDDFTPPSSYLRTVDLALREPSPRTIYAPEGCGRDRIVSDDVGTDGIALYWMTADRRILTASLAGGAVSELATFSSPSEPSHASVAAGNGYAYWTEGTTIFRTQIADASHAVRQIYRGTALHRLRTAPDGTLYFLSNSELVKLAASGDAIEIASGVSSFALAPSFVVYATGQNVWRQSATGGARTLLATLPRAGTVDALAVDSATAYAHLKPSIGGAPIFRIPLAAGAAASALTTDLESGLDVQSDGTDIVWLQVNDGIFRTAVRSLAVFPALGSTAITGIEITQAIQVNGNLIPLVGNKPTAVRVYAVGHPDGNGVWSGVSAALSVQGGRTHVAGPITLSPAGSNERVLSDSFVFLLDPGETAQGTRTITARLILPAGRNETAASANVATAMATFGAARDMTVYGYTYANENSSSTYIDAAGSATCASHAAAPDHVFRTFSDLATMATYLAMTYPVSSVTVVPLPGSGSVEYDEGPLGDNYCAGYLRADTDMPAMMESIPGTDRGYLMVPDYGTNGQCCAGSAAPNAHKIALGDDEVLADSTGATMAQEIGHSFGGALWLHPFNVGSEYPRVDTNHPGSDRDGPIGPVIGMRIPSIATEPGTDAAGNNTDWEFMSYHSTARWVDPFVYCKLYAGLSASAETCPATVEGGGPATSALPILAIPSKLVSMEREKASDAADVEPAALTVSGIETRTGRVAIARTEIADGQPAAESDGGNFILQLRDADGKTLAKQAFQVGYRSPPESVDLNLFRVSIRWLDATRSIVISDDKGTVLGERAVDPIAPKIRLIAQPGATLLQPQDIAWSAGGSPKAHLTYAIDYATEKSGWRRIATGLSASSYRLDPATLPSSPSARVRVIASNGVLEGIAQSSTFAVPAQPPSVTLVAPASARAGDVLLSATAWDPDAGAIGASHFGWFVDGKPAGMGRWIVATLTPGSHAVRVRVSGAAGTLAERTAVVLVREGPSLKPAIFK